MEGSVPRTYGDEPEVKMIVKKRNSAFDFEKMCERIGKNGPKSGEDFEFIFRVLQAQRSKEERKNSSLKRKGNKR